ncbi:hypothetical protein CSUI_001816, partial [Cystoisospora suis]
SKGAAKKRKDEKGGRERKERGRCRSFWMMDHIIKPTKEQ